MLSIYKIIDLFDRENYQTILSYFNEIFDDDQSLTLYEHELDHAYRIILGIVMMNNKKLLRTFLSLYTINIKPCIVKTIIKYNLTDMLRIILGTNPEILEDCVPLDLMIDQNRLDMIHILIGAGLDRVQDILYYGIKLNKISIVSEFIMYKSEIKVALSMLHNRTIDCISYGLPMIKLLIAADIDITQYINQILIMAVNKDDFDLAKFCVENEADIHYRNDLAFVTSCIHNNISMSIYLLQNGADINSVRNSLETLASRGEEHIIKFLVENNLEIPIDQINRLFILSAIHDHEPLTLYLMGIGADIHTDADAAILGAIYQGFVSIVGLLLDAGVNIHMINDDIMRIITKGINHLDMEIDHHLETAYNTYLTNWSNNNYSELLQLLFDHGAVISDPVVLAMWIYEGISDKVIEYVIQTGIDLRTKNINLHDLSPLKASIINGRTTVTKLLIENGADYDTESVELAIALNDTKTIELLLDHGVIFDPKFKHTVFIGVKKLFESYGIATPNLKLNRIDAPYYKDYC